MLFIVIPFRDEYVEQNRNAQRAQLLEYMSEYLREVPYHIFVIEQSKDEQLFNRGALVNIGFLLASEEAENDDDVCIFHDVDLLPDKTLQKEYINPPPQGTVKHLSAVEGCRYGKGGFGGIVSFNMVDFRLTNGCPNDYWGWGAEDLDLRRRVVQQNFKILIPTEGSIRDLEDLTLNAKLAYLKENKLSNPYRKNWKKKHLGWRQNGLNTLRYDIITTTRENDMSHVTVHLY